MEREDFLQVSLLALWTAVDSYDTGRGAQFSTWFVIELKKEFGDQVVFHGGIDIQHAVPGTLEEVEAEARTRIAAFAPGGGYIFAPSNHIVGDVPNENFFKLYESARQYGRYPIGGR